MDGLTFLRRIMRSDPLPVVICSTAAARGSDAAMRALEEGAVDVILKPAVGVREFLEESSTLLVDTLRAAAEARVGRRAPVKLALPAPLRVAGAIPSIVAIGASTGGTEALRVIIEALPENAPATVVVQHMPEGFTAAFANRLNATSRVEVKEAADGDEIRSGRVLIAPGNRHLLVRRGHVQITGGPLVSRHRPSVDVLFESTAKAFGASAVGVILTGMGDDGADGLRAMRNAGAYTIAQDEATSVIFGMPKEAIAHGGVEEVLPLQQIASALMRMSSRA
jgi:two-component system chemotaxis response regulator CheB